MMIIGPVLTAIILISYINIGATVAAKTVISLLENNPVTISKLILLLIFFPFSILILLLLALVAIIIWIVDLI